LLATCLIPVLAVAIAAVWLHSRPRPRYDPSAWIVVFPLGTYATASQQLGGAAGLYPVRLAGEGFTWPGGRPATRVRRGAGAAPQAALSPMI
jgi:tellurite resistance protein TehA-like permease